VEVMMNAPIDPTFSIRFFTTNKLITSLSQTMKM